MNDETEKEIIEAYSKEAAKWFGYPPFDYFRSGYLSRQARVEFLTEELDTLRMLYRASINATLQLPEGKCLIDKGRLQELEACYERQTKPTP